MLPALAPGDVLLAVRPRRLRRGDVVVVRLPGHGPLVKRVAAVPGDRVRVAAGRAAVEGPAPGEPPGPRPDGGWVLGAGEYLVEGDNRAESADLRAFGPVGREAVLGRATLRVWRRPGRVPPRRQ